ncbi:ricin-type beta-trefoil lectin domain protein [Streptomyces tateyamensis]|nr:ricin-type beta-trefoil lectin domain protein [Streptomyces tateyamensis]
MQWDPPIPPPAAPSSGTVTQARSLFAAPAAPATTSTNTSTPDAPGDSAHVAPITVNATATGIDLTPDQNVLGKGSAPWFIDPSISADSGTQHWVQVQENHPDTKNYDLQSPVGTGYCGYTAPEDCTGFGRYRAYFTIGISPSIYTQPGGAPSPPTVYDSKLLANVSDASSPSTNTPFGLYWTGPIDGNTTWSNQPCATNATMGGCAKVDTSSWLTGTGPISFNVTSQMQQAASQHWGNWTVGIAPDDESNKLFRHHLSISPGSAPHIQTNYDIQPSAWGPSITPQPGFASTNTHFPCNSGGTNPWDNVGWIGANQNIKLSVNSWSPAWMNLYSAFHVFWNSSASSGSWGLNSGWGGSVNTGDGANSVTIGLSNLQDGQVYGWNAGAYDYASPDSGLSSPWTGLCYFGIDRTPPTVSIGSTDFPPSGTPNPHPTKFAGQAGTFALHGTDPAPASGAASGVACFRISTDPSPVTGWKCTDPGIIPATTSSFQFTPGNWGTNIVYAQAQDNAGNYSQPTAYAFYAPWSPSSKAVFGDVTGDGKPDIVLPDNSGNLKLISSGADPTNAVSARAGLSPNGTSWNGVQFTHRGSLSQNISVDDLIAHTSSGVDLYQVLNTGNGTYNLPTTVGAMPSNCLDTSGKNMTCPAGIGGDWSKVTAIAAIGKPEGENNTPTSVSRTSLIAVVNSKLWLFHGAAESNNLGDYFDGTARLLSGSDWTNYDLINPGPANGGNQPTLWARNRADGTIHAYRITGGTTPNYTDFADPVANGIVLTGVNLPTGSYPTVGSSGDLNGDGLADLWATTPSGQLKLWSGAGTATTGAVIGFISTPAPNLVSMPGVLGHWKLDDDANSSKAADLVNQDPTDPSTNLGSHPGTVTNTTFASDNPSGTTNGTTNVAVFNGTSSEIDTAGTTVDTTKSFTIDAWIKPTSNGGVAVSQDGTTTAGFMLWPDRGTWRFAMANADATGWNYDWTGAANANATVQPNIWAHLTARYNSNSGQMSLYVNGALANSGYHKPTSAISGKLTIGRWWNNKAAASYFNGSISDVTVYDSTAQPGTATGAISIGAPTPKCLDLNQGITTNGNSVQVYDCNGSAAQKWTFNPDGTLTANGGCLDASRNGTANGTLTEIWTCTGSANQQWLPQADGSILNPVSNRCLDDPSWNTTNGTRPQLYDCNATPAQNWAFSATAN